MGLSHAQVLWFPFKSFQALGGLKLVVGIIEGPWFKPSTWTSSGKPEKEEGMPVSAPGRSKCGHNLQETGIPESSGIQLGAWKVTGKPMGR